MARVDSTVLGTVANPHSMAMEQVAPRLEHNQDDEGHQDLVMMTALSVIFLGIASCTGARFFSPPRYRCYAVLEIPVHSTAEVASRRERHGTSLRTRLRADVRVASDSGARGAIHGRLVILKICQTK